MRLAAAALVATAQALVAPTPQKPSTRLHGRASKLVIWDCDGVLVDSEALLKRAEVDALYRKYNPEKLGDVDQLAAQFGSGVLLTKVREKYAKHREERCQECEKHLIVSAPLPNTVCLLRLA